MRTVVLFACLMLSAACGSQELDTARAESARLDVPARINEPFKRVDIDAQMWAERFEGESREVYTARLDVLAALALQPGEDIADIGAGTGLFVKLFAQAVGPAGTVYANDIAPAFLRFIEERSKGDGLNNVVTLLGEDRSSKLPAASVDVVFHSDVYHHFEFPEQMNADLFRALRPGGRLFVLDFERIEGVSPQQRLEHVRAPKEVVRAEIETAGFVFDREIELEPLVENYLLVFVKPKG